jgi:hypothetical protein
MISREQQKHTGGERERGTEERGTVTGSVRGARGSGTSKENALLFSYWMLGCPTSSLCQLNSLSLYLALSASVSLLIPRDHHWVLSRALCLCASAFLCLRASASPSRSSLGPLSRSVPLCLCASVPLCLCACLEIITGSSVCLSLSVSVFLTTRASRCTPASGPRGFRTRS